VLSQVVITDASSTLPVVNYFVGNNLTGGWEGWLQVEYARAVLGSNLQATDFAREVNFDYTALRCDLVFTPSRGTRMWVELKTQRTASYKNTVSDFEADINKIYTLSSAFKAGNVLIAAAVLKLQAGDANKLNELRNGVKGGVMKYLLVTGIPANPLLDVTSTISTAVTGANQLLIATYQAN
jgi:hypothetical protein